MTTIITYHHTDVGFLKVFTTTKDMYKQAKLESEVLKDMGKHPNIAGECVNHLGSY